jgi:hypothetical protein
MLRLFSRLRLANVSADLISLRRRQPCKVRASIALTCRDEVGHMRNSEFDLG